ncbi:hypothetical protein AgCh_011362 [Apium graveolens]
MRFESVEECVCVACVCVLVAGNGEATIDDGGADEIEGKRDETRERKKEKEKEIGERECVVWKFWPENAIPGNSEKSDLAKLKIGGWGIKNQFWRSPDFGRTTAGRWLSPATSMVVGDVGGVRKKEKKGQGQNSL